MRIAATHDYTTIADNLAAVRRPSSWPQLGVLKSFFNGLLASRFRTVVLQSVTLELKAEEADADRGLRGHGHRCEPHHRHVRFHGPRSWRGAGLQRRDTGPTDRLWEVLNETPDLKALLMEVSFPTSEHRLAHASGHHTPETLITDLRKLELRKELPTLLYHIKPSYQAAVERECGRLMGVEPDGPARWATNFLL